MRSASEPRFTGRVPFTDGTMRDVFEDAAGRQYVVVASGEPVYGTWLPPPDEPVAINASQPGRGHRPGVREPSRPGILEILRPLPRAGRQGRDWRA
jgi:hypothetical protein